MKYVFMSLMTLAVIVSGCAAPGGGRTAILEDVCEGTGQGRRGPIAVQVRMSGGSITEIVVVDSEEDRFVGGAAMEELIDMVIMYNSTDIDAISGATESSRGFLEAVDNAIMLR